MDAILVIVQLGLLVICCVSGVAAAVMMIADRRPKHKTTKCRSCQWWIWIPKHEMGQHYEDGWCSMTGQDCRAGKRACSFERRGK